MPAINTTLNDVFRSTSVGDVRSAIGSVLYGINHRQTPGAVPINRDYHGYTFFTRPQFNLTEDNVSNLRKLVPLLTTEEVSIQRMVRKLLDPRLAEQLPCPIVDDTMAFIPILSNHLLSCSGWPDPTLDYYTSKQGVYKEEFSFIDGTMDQFSAYNISTTFRNMVGDPVMLIFVTWLWYMQALYKGEMIPYPDMIRGNEIDYNTRIYRVVLDKNKRLVQKIACCGAAFPVSAPEGQAFNFEHDQPRNASNDSIQINFRAMGYNYDDHIVIREFNMAVGTFNPNMRDDRINDKMIQLSPAELSVFNNRGYPRIDPDTLEMQWWVTPGQYSAIMAAYARNAGAVGAPTDPDQYAPD